MSELSSSWVWKNFYRKLSEYLIGGKMVRLEKIPCIKTCDAKECITYVTRIDSLSEKKRVRSLNSRILIPHKILDSSPFFFFLSEFSLEWEWGWGGRGERRGWVRTMALYRYLYRYTTWKWPRMVKLQNFVIETLYLCIFVLMYFL